MILGIPEERVAFLKTLKENYTIFLLSNNNSIQLNNLSNLNNTSIKIFNLIGKEVISASNTKSIIDISTLVNGIYILNIKSENKSIKIKFIKI